MFQTIQIPQTYIIYNFNFKINTLIRQLKMAFSIMDILNTHDVKKLIDILKFAYKSAKKKKYEIPNTFEQFIQQEVNKGNCPEQCLDLI